MAGFDALTNKVAGMSYRGSIGGNHSLRRRHRNDMEPTLTRTASIDAAIRGIRVVRKSPERSVLWRSLPDQPGPSACSAIAQDLDRSAVSAATIALWNIRLAGTMAPAANIRRYTLVCIAFPPVRSSESRRRSLDWRPQVSAARAEDGVSGFSSDQDLAAGTCADPRQNRSCRCFFRLRISPSSPRRHGLVGCWEVVWRSASSEE